ncbi:hypothetical protein HW132_34080 [Brasilonema sp. CT11]|nr:hypothetical protein [Brasilonema sp. CT11]
MYKLTKEEEEIVEKHRKFNDRINSVPESERIPLSNPKKWNFPIGMDDNGELFPVHEKKPKKSIKNLIPLVRWKS